MIHSNKNTLSPRAYTLVELIVVIAILVVLSTVGFVGYSQYTASSRDGARVSDLRAIYQGIGVSISQKGIAPSPDSPISIYSSTGVLLSLQGSVGDTVRQAIGLESGGRDPMDGVGYTYLRNKDKKSVQLLGMFESDGWGAKMAVNNLLTPDAYAATDYTDRYPATFGKKLGILVDSTTNTPLQQVSSYTASGVNLGLTSIATGSGILVIGNTGSGVSENLSGTGVLARVLSPASLVVAGGSTVAVLLNCDQVSNATGADGDLSECLDTRTYTHPAAVVTANGGNANFFDRKYDLIKMNGKWWMNENLKYPKTTDFHMPPASTNNGLAFACPSDIVSGYSAGTPKCDLVNTLGYIYAIFNTDICPTGWALPSEAEVNGTNTSAGGINPHRVSGKWNTTQVETHSIYNLSGYWGSTGVLNEYLGNGGFTWFVNMTSTDTANYGPVNSFKTVAAYLGYPAYSYQARCIKS